MKTKLLNLPLLNTSRIHCMYVRFEKSKLFVILGGFSLINKQKRQHQQQQQQQQQ